MCLLANLMTMTPSMRSFWSFIISSSNVSLFLVCSLSLNSSKYSTVEAIPHCSQMQIDWRQTQSRFNQLYIFYSRFVFDEKVSFICCTWMPLRRSVQQLILSRVQWRIRMKLACLFPLRIYLQCLIIQYLSLMTHPIRFPPPRKRKILSLLIYLRH